MSSKILETKTSSGDSKSQYSLLRSAKMSLIQLYIPIEAANDVVAELGESSCIQFRDLNSHVHAFQKTFTSKIRELDEMERKILLLIDHALREKVNIRSWISCSPNPMENSVALRGKALQEIDELLAQLTENEDRILQLDSNQSELKQKYLSLLEWRGVLETLSPYLSSGLEVILPGTLDHDKDFIDIEGRSSKHIQGGAQYVAGAISSMKIEAFEKVLWRALRGNILIRSSHMEINTKGISKSEMPKNNMLNHNSGPCDGPTSSFIAYVHGQETLSRLKKICIALGARLYNVDSNLENRNADISELSAKIDDVFSVLFNTSQAKKAALGRISESLERWLILVRKKKCLLDTMNRFSCENDISSRKYYIAEGWCATQELTNIDITIRKASDRAGLSISPVVTVLEPSENLTPPTFFKLNLFTNTFQGMTDSYSICKYQEINPSLFMITTFPFLFAVMFGDVGHAFIMIAFAAVMIVKDKNFPKGEILAMFFDARYLILLMGIFSVFIGIIYNDVFAVAMALFPSAWTYKAGEIEPILSNPNYVYPMGIDVAWASSLNMMEFLNSFKMKQAIVLGFLQMTFGLSLSACNAFFFRDSQELICVLLPQFIFLLSTIGYLVFLIIYKWIVGFDQQILTIFLGMMIGLGSVEGDPIYSGQLLVQKSLLGFAVICVPWMLISKPILIMRERKKLEKQGYSATKLNSSSGSVAESISSTTRKASADDDDEHSIANVWIHQMIHGIEFILGSISNTASYLRLWALSLAHQQLSHVLWGMAMEKATGSWFLLICTYPFWLGASLAILVAMEGISAFLHALRLHWVEFNSKFFIGGGVEFTPFTLRDDLMITSTEADD